MSPDFLELREVSHSFGGQTVLRKVNWTVSEGENWAVIGPNGAGKTTLVRIACGFLWPNQSGKVVRKGQLRPNLREMWKSIGWISAELINELPGKQTALETVLTGKFATTRCPREVDSGMQRQAEKLLTNLSAGALEDKKFGELSQGEKQKVLVGRALMAEPYLLVFDEPCAGLDPGARETFLEFLAGVDRNRQGVGIILITHHVEEITPLFSKVLAVKEGRVVGRGNRSEVLKDSVLSTLYDCEFASELVEGRYWPVVSENSG